MNTLDSVVFFAYLAGVLTIGAWISRKQKGVNDYFLAGRKMFWLPIGLSVMATAFSAINYAAFSGEVFGHGLYVLLCLPVFVFIIPVITRIIMPFYHSMGVGSAYEYLEKRFDVKVRCLASGLFILWRLFWMATLLYVPCKVMSLITGWSVPSLILLAGLTATLYTAAGGIKAVMWSDVFQFIVLFSGILISVLIAVGRIPGGFGGLLRISGGNGLLMPFFPFDREMLSLDPHIRISLWSAWIGSFTAFFARYGVDQVVVQRYFTASSLKNAKTGFQLNCYSAIASLLLLALMGLAIYVHARQAGILGTMGASPLPYFSAFIRESLPSGVTGLVVAGLFAATMSSLDSGTNSCCMAFITDFYNRFLGKGQNMSLAFSRIVSLAFGILSTLMALYIGRLGTIFEIMNKVINGFGGPLLAIFMMGMFSRLGNSRGVFAGGLLGAFWSGYVSFGVKGIALHYYAVLNLIGTLVFCLIGSLVVNRLAGGPSEEKLSWTWKARRRLERNDPETPEAAKEGGVDFQPPNRRSSLPSMP